MIASSRRGSGGSSPAQDAQREFRPQTELSQRGAEVMGDAGQELGPAVDQAQEPTLHAVERGSGHGHFTRPVSGRGSEEMS
jgi:hypothetical protein